MGCVLLDYLNVSIIEVIINLNYKIRAYQIMALGDFEGWILYLVVGVYWK